MSTKKDNSEEKNPLKILGIIIPFLPKLAIKSGGAFIRFKLEAKKAGKIFYKELIKQGIDKKTADDLTDYYLESSNIFHVFKK